MRTPVFLVLLAAGALHLPSLAQQGGPAVKVLTVRAQPGVPDMECEKKRPAAHNIATPNPDPLEVPSDDLVQEMADEALPEAESPPPAGATAPSSIRGLPTRGGYRIGIWGDSHLAAAFISEELARQLKMPLDSVSNVTLPANMGRGGVRLPIRRSCVSSDWKYEPNYTGGDGAAAPGPGLINMIAEQPGATLAWDVRTANGPSYDRVRILYQQTAEPIVVALSVDGAPEKEVTLDGRAGPAVLELAADGPLSQVRLRLVDARLRFHGLELLAKNANPYRMDVFGWPGATVASWKVANQDYLRAWTNPNDYQLVILEFGTNEGNVKPFDLAAYRSMLTESVHNMRTQFPTAACVLISPGDRGVLVPHSANTGRGGKTAAKGKGKGKNKAAARHAGKGSAKAVAKGAAKRRAAPNVDLFKYSRIHASIGQAQRDVALEAGCSAWSMLDAMGGPGRAYDWAHQTPPLMARDLIHFTVAGYQRFAQQFAKDMGWVP